MAAAFPVIPALVGVGAFGEHVTRILARRLPGAAVFTELVEAFTSGPGPVLLASWRPAPALCDHADLLAHSLDVAWLPVVHEDPVIQIGPWVEPGAGPCYRCYHDRRCQHDHDGRDTEALHAAYDRDESLGPGGFLPQHARTAAGLAAAVLDRREGAVGRVTTVDLARLRLLTSHVVSVHGCDRCAPGQHPYRDMADLLRLTGTEPADV
ncbi:TOMM precursor leader peptide-binding protein [Spirillospora sp. NBC_00431]